MNKKNDVFNFEPTLPLVDTIGNEPSIREILRKHYYGRYPDLFSPEQIDTYTEMYIDQMIKEICRKIVEGTANENF